jgi:hypothetical protein
MKRIVLLSLIAILFVNCVSKTEYEKLEMEKEKLTNENLLQFAKIEFLNSKIKEFEQEKEKAETQKNKIKWYSNKQALNYLKDYYDFYQTDLKFKDEKIRRVSDNEFKISLTECLKKMNHCYAKVYTLTIDNKGKYTMNY